MPKSLITTVPFGDKNRLPIELLENAEIEYLINPLNKKLTEDKDIIALAGLDNQVIEDRVYSLEEFTKNFLKGEK